MTYYLAFDVGGSSIKYALIDDDLNITNKGKMPGSYESLEKYLLAFKSVYELHKDKVSGVACSMAGIIDPKNGYFYSQGIGNPFVQGKEMATIIENYLGCPVSIENDARCAAKAELNYGSLKGVLDGAMIVLGTGIGGSIIVNGKTLTGKHFSAGEFSAVSLNLISESFNDNLWALRNGSLGLRNQVNNALNEMSEMSGEEIFDRAEKGEEAVINGLHAYCHELAGQILNIQTMLDPERISIGGGISDRQILFDILDEEIKKTMSALPPIIVLNKPDIRKASFGNDANLIGAVCHFKELEKDY